MTPEERARQAIDALLEGADWTLQDAEARNRNVALGVAMREFTLPAGPCDDLAFVDGKAAGVIEAKKQGFTLSGVAGQSGKNVFEAPEHLAFWSEPLPLPYESTGDETFFRYLRDPKSRFRRVFAFHRPGTLL